VNNTSFFMGTFRDSSMGSMMDIGAGFDFQLGSAWSLSKAFSLGMCSISGNLDFLLPESFAKLPEDAGSGGDKEVGTHGDRVACKMPGPGTKDSGHALSGLLGSCREMKYAFLGLAPS
jgi:hypothetical protein